MERIAFYGKGGIGKSTIAAGVSLALAKQGKRVLHVGCDPKHDSTACLVQDGRVVTVIDLIFSRPVGQLKAADLIMAGKHGIDCIEAGGPEAGVGCGGRAISRMFEVFDELELIDPDRYDAAVFDVLGDVVCGGFAAPLRSDIAPKVVIVASEEMMAGYAANNIAKAVLHYLHNGVSLAGMVINLRDNQADQTPIERLAEALGTRILARIPRTPQIQQAELQRRSILDHDPDAPASRNILALAEELLALGRGDCPAPKPLDLEGVRQIMLGDGQVRRGPEPAGQGDR
jgi:nitrogenase subunit NifH